jgi:hypothetical protein
MVNFELETGDNSRFSVEILGLRLKMMKFQFGPSICENYSLVPYFGKIIDWSLEHNPRFWIELKMNYGQNSSIVMNL